MSEETITIKYIKGVGGSSLSINDYRVAGSRPWGGGKTIRRWEVPLKEILTALNITNIERIERYKRG